MMELQNLQSQLKSAIQSHQIVLSKMRIDPQNTALQKQLHDLQAEIRALSDKQKQVVQQLRSDLERNNSTVLKLSTHNTQVLPRTMLSSPVKLQGTLKGGGMLLPNVVVVPPTSRGDPPPIRVPQYPPVTRNVTTSCLPAGTVTTPRVPKTTTVTVVVSTTSCKTSCAPVMCNTTASSASPPLTAAVPPDRLAVVTTPRVKPVKEDNNKIELMKALGLMTREALNELQNRRGERKRRTTANPHFSSAALEEKRKNAAIIAELTGKGRPRGRPRLGSTTSPANSHPGSPETSSNDTAVTVNGHVSPPPPAIKKEEDPGSPTNCDRTSSEVGPLRGGNPLDWVSDYALLKNAKAGEKQKLLKRSLELKTERMQLEEKKQQLSEIIANQQKRRVELQAAYESVQAAVERLESVVQCFKEAS